jgi:integrase
MKILRNKLRGTIETYSPGSVREFFETVYSPLKLGGRAQTTRKRYRDAIRKLSAHLGREAMLADLSDEMVSALMGSLADRGLAPPSVNAIRKKLCALWTLAAKKRRVDTWPDVAPWPEFKRLPNSWDLDEIEAILTAASQTQGAYAEIPAGQWWLALLLTLFDTSLRIGAALKIRRADLNLETRQVLVRAETQKQKADQRFRLSHETIAVLRRIDSRRELLFPWPKCEGSLYNAYGRILAQAGLPNGPKDKFHRLRRTGATLLTKAAGRAVATEHLGHSGARVTEAYIDESKLDEVGACDLLPRPALPVLIVGSNLPSLGPVPADIRELLDRAPLTREGFRQIVAYAKSKGMRQIDLAKQAGISFGHLLNVLNGERSLARESHDRLRAAFSLDPLPDNPCEQCGQPFRPLRNGRYCSMRCTKAAARNARHAAQ